jgi:hypothetical protein
MGSWNISNMSGETPLQLAEKLKNNSPDYAAIFNILTFTETERKRIIIPNVLKLLDPHIPVRDLARICCEYL